MLGTGRMWAKMDGFMAGYKRAPQGATPYTDANGNVKPTVRQGKIFIDVPPNGIPLLDDAADTRIAKSHPIGCGGMTHSFCHRDFYHFLDL